MREGSRAMRASEKLIIETPELIPLEFPLAGTGSRLLAMVFDTLIQGAASLAIMIPTGLLMGASSLWEEGSHWALAIVIVLLFLIQYAYFAGFETVWDGQTPGKRRLGIRVIKESGRPINGYDALARNLIRIVDQIPGVYAVGLVSVLLSSQNKRLGDYVAGTVVVHERPVAETPSGWSERGPAAEIKISPAKLATLTAPEYDLVEAFLARRSELGEEVRWRMAGAILDRLAERLDLTAAPSADRERILEAIARERGRVREGRRAGGPGAERR